MVLLVQDYHSIRKIGVMVYTTLSANLRYGENICGDVHPKVFPLVRFSIRIISSTSWSIWSCTTSKTGISNPLILQHVNVVVLASYLFIALIIVVKEAISIVPGSS